MRNFKNEESRSKTHTRAEQGIPTIPFVLLPVTQQQKICGSYRSYYMDLTESSNLIT